MSHLAANEYLGARSLTNPPWRSGDGSGVLPRWQTWLLLALVAAMLLTLNICLSPFYENNADDDFNLYVRLGVFFGQSMLVGVWAVFGPGPLVIRLVGALVICALAALTQICGILRNGDEPFSTPEALLLPAWAMIGCAAVQMPLWWTRIRRGWRIVDAHSPERETRSNDSRFGMLALMGGVTAIAITFALYRLIPVYDEGATLAAVLEFLWETVMPLELVAFALPVVPMVGIVLARRRRWPLWLGFVLMLALSGLISYLESGWFSSGLLDFAAIVVGVLAGTAIPLTVLRACGFELIRPRVAPRAERVRSRFSPRWRFAIMLTALGLAATLVGYWAVTREFEREFQRQVKRQREALAALSFEPVFEGTHVFELALADKWHFSDPSQHRSLEQNQIDAILGTSELRTLHLNRAAVSDELLSRFVTIPSLRALMLAETTITDQSLPSVAQSHELLLLDLSSTAITDEGVAHLGELSRLQHLRLAHTSITFASLPTLERLTELRWLDLTGTEITPEGIERLHMALPRAQIVTGGLESAAR